MDVSGVSKEVAARCVFTNHGPNAVIRVGVFKDPKLNGSLKFHVPLIAAYASRGSTGG